MAPMKASSKSMKAMKATGGKAMTKTALADKLATAVDLKRSQVVHVLGQLSEIGAAEVVQSGKFTIPGLCMIKTREPETVEGIALVFHCLVCDSLVCGDAN